MDRRRRDRNLGIWGFGDLRVWGFKIFWNLEFGIWNFILSVS
jgi:hypothetical protein